MSSGIIWAIGKYFFIKFFFFLINISSFYLRFKGTKAARTKTGLNNVSGHMVWAISMFIFLYLVFYIY